MATYVRLVSAVSRLAGLAAIALLVAAVLVVTHMVVMRYFLNASTIWQTDFVVFAATAAVFVGAPYVLMTKGHVGVDVIETMVQPPVKRGMRYVGSLLGLTFCAVMFVASWMYFHEAWEEGWTTSSLWRLPLWIPVLPMPIGFGLLCLQYLAEILKLGEAEA